MSNDPQFYTNMKMMNKRQFAVKVLPVLFFIMVVSIFVNSYAESPVDTNVYGQDFEVNLKKMDPGVENPISRRQDEDMGPSKEDNFDIPEEPKDEASKENHGRKLKARKHSVEKLQSISPNRYIYKLKGITKRSPLHESNWGIFKNSLRKKNSKITKDIFGHKDRVNQGKIHSSQDSKLSIEEDKVVSGCDDKEKFDIQAVTRNFKSCLNDINFENYINAYKELYRFFKLMGTVFSLVARDIDEKVKIMEKLMKSSKGKYYKNLQSMIRYEKRNKLLQKPGFVSGSRTMLRLHRALEFVSKFMFELSVANVEDSTSNLAQESYKSTLAKYHGWVLRKGGLVAMYALPKKGDLIKTVVSEECLPKMNTVNKAMRDLSNSAIRVFSRTQKIYKNHNLLNLP